MSPLKFAGRGDRLVVPPAFVPSVDGTSVRCNGRARPPYGPETPAEDLPRLGLPEWNEGPLSAGSHHPPALCKKRTFFSSGLCLL